MIKKWMLFIILGLFTLKMTGCGTLGGFDNISFPTTKKTLENAIDTFFRENPEYVIPNKWQKYDDWNNRGYGFLETRIFYFNSSPEEMYYVSFVGDGDAVHDSTKQIILSIRSVFSVKSGWLLEKEIEISDRKRIMDRFNKEVISKLEIYTNTQSY